jgi:hypothetical protein
MHAALIAQWRKDERGSGFSGLFQAHFSGAAERDMLLRLRTASQQTTLQARRQE